MIILDTNVYSALMRLEDNPRVAAWIDRQELTGLYVSAPTVFEIQHGICRRPHGRRRRALEASFTAVMNDVVHGRVLPLDHQAAIVAGQVRARQKANGNNAKVPDTLIAGIAIASSARVATRDTHDFGGLGLELINPWN